MDTPFQYDRYATGKNFVGRKGESVTLESLIRSNQNVVLYDAPKSGKGSLIRHALYQLKVDSYDFMACHASLASIRDRGEFLNEYATAVFRAAASDPGEMEDLHGEYLAGTCLEFNPSSYKDSGPLFAIGRAPESKDNLTVLSLPERISEHFSKPVIIIIEHFQDFMLFEDWEDMLGTLETVWKERKNAVYVISGSKINAMKEIFEEKRFFYRFAEYLPLQPVDERELTEYIIRGFSKGGKIIERDLALGAVRLFENNCWYINQFSAICDSLSRGYINENTLVEALGMLLSLHSVRFREIVGGLTSFQLNLLKAILEGTVRFSSAETIDKYGLNSSANVRRLKDALKKKEIVTFDKDDIPQVIDPLFKYWMTKIYYKNRI